MFRAFGTIAVLYAVSQMLSGAFSAFEDATVATFGALESAAIQSQKQFDQLN